MGNEEDDCKHSLRLIDKYKMVGGQVLKLIVECKICKEKFEGILFKK